MGGDERGFNAAMQRKVAGTIINAPKAIHMAAVGTDQKPKQLIVSLVTRSTEGKVCVADQSAVR